MRHVLRSAALLAAGLLLSCSDDEPSGPASIPYLWSLDLDLSGVSLRGLKQDTAVTSEVTDEVTGRVIGYDPAVGEDTVRFRNQEHDQFLVNAPLAADGSFRFDGAELVGDLDGSMTLHVFHAPRVEGRRAEPDTLTIDLDRPCGGRPCE